MKNGADKFNVSNLHNLNREEKDKEKRGARLTPRLRSILSVWLPLVCGCGVLYFQRGNGLGALQVTFA